MRSFSPAGKLLSVALTASLLTMGGGILPISVAGATEDNISVNEELIPSSDVTLNESSADNIEESDSSKVEETADNTQGSVTLSNESLNLYNTAKDIAVQAAGDPTTEEAADRIFTADQVTLTGMPVTDVNQNPVNEEITFTFWNATMERFEDSAKSVNGVLEDKVVYKGHRYIVYCENKIWNFSCTCGNAYFILNETGNQPINDRSKTEGAVLPRFQLKQRDAAVADAKEARRVEVELALWLYDTDLDDFDEPEWEDDFSDVRIKFTNAYGDVAISSAPDSFGNITVKLLEDMPYTLSIESETLCVLSYPVVVKDHSEQDQPKKAYDHFSCGQHGIVLFYKEQFDDAQDEFNTSLKSTSGKTTVEGTAFNQKVNAKMPFAMKQVAAAPRYGLTERILEKTLANEGLKGDFEVYDFATINLARSEKSNLMTDGYQTFKITTEVAGSKNVASVSYINSEGKLVPVTFTKEADGKISWSSLFLGVYPYVIQYSETPGNTYEPAVSGDVKFDVAKGDKVTFTFKSTAENDNSFELFSGLEIDGNLVPSSNYTVSKGSTIITLNDDYTATLANGAHIVKALFEGGTQFSEITFTIGEASTPTDPSQPTDPSNPSTPTDPTTPVTPPVASDDNRDNVEIEPVANNNVAGSTASASTLSKTGDNNLLAFAGLGVLALFAGGLVTLSVVSRKKD